MIDCLLTFSRLLKNSHDLGDHQLVQELRELFTNPRLDKIDLDKRIQTYLRTEKELNDARNWGYNSAAEQEAFQQQAEERYDTAHRELLDSLHDHIFSINNKLEDMLRDVEAVLTCHFTATSQPEARQQLQENLSCATLDHTKEEILINFYFDRVLPEVTQGLPVSSAGTPQRSSLLRPPSISVTDSDASTLANPISDTRSAIWLALMFKMCSWLFLHDFNPEDRMIERSESMNNRLPVYIG
jgi:hypothetical protein